MNGFFYADILISFITCNVHNRKVIDNPKKIIVNYLTGWFIIDVISVFPFD